MEPEIMAGIVPAELIRVVQLPEIAEQLIAVKEKWQKSAEEALSMVCTEEALKQVKAKRAEINKEFEDMEDRRKWVKAAIMDPYKRFEAIYKDCVSNPYETAYDSLTGKINNAESELKRRCEDDLRRYFDELCAVHRLDWLTYERAGIKVDMASAKAKTPVKLRKQLEDFVVRVSDSVNRINLLDDADEIMVEYQRTLDAVDAISTVQDRHRRIEEQRATQEARRSEDERESEMVRRVEALAAPLVVARPPEKDPDEIIPVCAFTIYDAPRRILRQIKEILNMEGIKYE